MNKKHFILFTVFLLINPYLCEEDEYPLINYHDEYENQNDNKASTEEIQTEECAYNNEKTKECNSEILEMFDLKNKNEIKQDKTDQNKQNEEIEDPFIPIFCSHKRFSCCKNQDILALSQIMKKPVAEFNRKLNFLEELMTIFTGPNMSKLIQYLIPDSNLEKINAEISQNIKATIEKVAVVEWNSDIKESDKLDHDKYQIDLGNSVELLEEFDAFRKTQLRFYYNQICSICDYNKRRKFYVDKKTYWMSFESCQQVIRNKVFQYRLNFFLNFAVYPLANTISASFLEKRNHLLGEKIEIEKFDYEYFRRYMTLEKCVFLDIDISSQCSLYCNDDFRTFKFDIIDLQKVKIALRILFKSVNISHKINYYYRRVHKQEYNMPEDKEKIIVFHGSSNGDDEKQGTKTKNYFNNWRICLWQDGMDIFNNEIDPKFYKDL